MANANHFLIGLGGAREKNRRVEVWLRK